VCSNCDSNYVLSNGICILGAETKCNNITFESNNNCIDIVENYCIKPNKIPNCKEYTYDKSSGICKCNKCLTNLYLTMNACVNLYDTNVLACQNKIIPNCLPSGKLYDKKTNDCLCLECQENYVNLNYKCEDYYNLDKCFYMQGKSKKDIPFDYCLKNLNLLQFKFTNYCNTKKDKNLPKDIRNFYVFSQQFSVDYIYLGLLDSLKANEYLICNDTSIFAYHFLSFADCDIFNENIIDLLDKISEMDNIRQKNLLNIDLLEGYMKNCNKDVNFTNSERLRDLCIQGSNNLVDFQKQKCSSNKFCSDQDYKNIITTNANNTKCYLCNKDFFYVEKLKDCYVGFIKDSKSRDLWQLALLIIAGIFLLIIVVLLFIKICSKNQELKEEIRFYISSILNILDILLDLTFLLSSLYQYTIYKWINLGIFLLHPAFFYVAGIVYFCIKHRKSQNCCYYIINFFIFPVVFCILNLLGIFGSPNKLFKENELLQYYIDIDLDDQKERKNYKLKMKIIDLFCESIPEIALKIVINISSDNWGPFQILSLTINILNLVYCSYVILVEQIEIDKLPNNEQSPPNTAIEMAAIKQN